MPGSGRWRNAARPRKSRRSRREESARVRSEPADGDAALPASRDGLDVDLKKRIGTAAFAFRGYDVSNLGKSPELLEHKAFGPVVRAYLDEASALCAEVVRRPVDLAARVRDRVETTLASFPEDVATIVAMELAQVRLLEEFFDVPVHQAKLCFGYSLGEVAALIYGGVFAIDQALPIPLALAEDCAELAADTSMGIVFTRGPALPMPEVERLCTAISSEGRGLIGPSAFLSPNTALVLGQGDTLGRLESRLSEFLPIKVSLRRNPHRWPPLHTPLVWQRNIPNRTATALYKVGGGMSPPDPPILSCVTGAVSYDGVNSRDLMVRWTDHPQRLWDAVAGTLASGVEVVVHAGPEPKLIGATFARLSNNVCKQVGHMGLNLLGHSVVPRMNLNRYTWLARLLPSQTALLRAPFVAHVTLEDWLLAQPLP
ncbi:MAG TPA: ACP S-malonyltransferase [Isosphaeraceae bacterium]|jgi:[acyl-carrier-protein] S-malonyltransferase|nr:ACP S-malonyltransferase [Isosphaeraceae bacterium]